MPYYFHQGTETMGQFEPPAGNTPDKEPQLRRFAMIGASLPILFSGLFVLAAYVWLVSCGLWTKWPSTSTYYDQLAASFSHGNLALETKPDPALLALPDPYDPAARAGIQVPTDVSLYNGKYYLYFGPVPALPLMMARLFFPGVIGDQYLVFVFVSGIFIFLSLLLVKIRERFFPEISPWLLSAGILAAGLISPLGWVLSLPTVYNAAITGGEFFFLAGFYSAFRAMDRDPISNWWLTAAGLFWIAALGSRITQILSIGFMTLMVMIFIVCRYRRKDQFSRSIPLLLALGLPLAVGLAVLGWYDWARFGSLFETGITYQLAGPFLQKYHNDIFSPVYIVQNLYNYLLIPPKLKSAFPFLIPVYGNLIPILSFLPLPTIYYSQEITGYLFNAPFILFAIAPAVSLFSILRRQPKNPMNESDRSLFNWLMTGLLGTFLIGFAFFLVFFWVATRYFTDFIPTLVVLSVIGFWQLHLHFARRPVSQFIFTLGGLGLIAISIVASNLIALSLNSGRFRSFDPVLWRQLVNFIRY
jgi:hypothetical protein